MYSRSAVYTVRFFFLLVCGTIGGLIAAGLEQPVHIGIAVACFFASVLIAVDILARNWSFRNFSAATFGLMVGLFCAWLLSRIDFAGVPMVREMPNSHEVVGVIHLALYLSLGFLGSSLALRSNREEFSLILPYVRFRNEGVEEQPTLLDSNILIDGRILKLVRTGFLRGPFIVPRFVLEEMQRLADSQRALKRERGRRGLVNVQELRRRSNAEVRILDDYEDRAKLSVDARLVILAQRLAARLLTNDSGLGQVARVQGVQILNLNDLADAMRPEVLVGDVIEVDLVKRGKDDHQAVGYMPDGTMIVVNNAAKQIGSHMEVVVASVIQTASGRMIFSDPASAAGNGKNVGGAA